MTPTFLTCTLQDLIQHARDAKTPPVFTHVRELRTLFASQGGRCPFTQRVLSLRKGGASLVRVGGSYHWVYPGLQGLLEQLTPEEVRRTCKAILASGSESFGLLYGSRVYMGGNLENAKSGHEVVAWREALRTELGKLGIICLSPIDDVFVGHMREDAETNATLRQWRENGEYDKVRQGMKRIVQKDLRMVDISDFAVFNVDTDHATYGTTHEFVQAAQQRKPIFLIVKNRNKAPLWFLRYIGPESIFEGLDELIAHLRGLNSGDIPLDIRYWKVLLKQYRLQD